MVDLKRISDQISNQQTCPGNDASNFEFNPKTLRELLSKIKVVEMHFNRDIFVTAEVVMRLRISDVDAFDPLSLGALATNPFRVIEELLHIVEKLQGGEK